MDEKARKKLRHDYLAEFANAKPKPITDDCSRFIEEMRQRAKRILREEKPELRN